VNEPDATPVPAVMVQAFGVVTTTDPPTVQAPLASEAKPTPVKLISSPAVPIRGERVTRGFTVKVVEPLSGPQVTVMVYVPLAGAPGPLPTVKIPCPVSGGSLKTSTMGLLTGIPPGPLPVTEQTVPAGAVVILVRTVTTSPATPDVGVRVIVRTAALTLGS